MTLRTRGVIVAGVHLAIVATLGVKLLVDRTTRPRVWAQVAPVDPDLPIRGRYVRLRVEGTVAGEVATRTAVRVEARDGALVFVPSTTPTGLWVVPTRRPDGRDAAVLDAPLAFFIPEHAADPSLRAPGEELWAEVTVPRRGAPRPIRLGVRTDGVLTPLETSR